MVRPSIALSPRLPRFRATCGVTGRFRYSSTNPKVSNSLSPPTVSGCVPGSLSIITSAASRSAVPLAWKTSASTISPFRFSTNRFPLWLNLDPFPSLLRASREWGSVLDLGFVRALLPAKVHCGVARIIRRSRRLALLEAVCSSETEVRHQILQTLIYSSDKAQCDPALWGG